MNTLTYEFPDQAREAFDKYRNLTVLTKTSYGWQGKTRIDAGNSKAWVITTSKGSRGTISTHCHLVTVNEGGHIEFMMFGTPANEDFHVNVMPGVKLGETKIRELHYLGLAEFDRKQAAGETAKPAEGYQIAVGQILFTDFQGSHDDKRAVCAIMTGGKYKTVLLDGTTIRHDDHIRPYSQKFGIGVYYNEGETISQEEVNALVIVATDNMQKQSVIDDENRQKAAIAEAEKKAFLSQYKTADRGQTTNIIKRHIAATFKTVSDVKIKSVVFSGGSSMHVTYTSPEPVQALEDFIKTFNQGHFNSMEDMYEYSNSDQEIILEGHILVKYKYADARHVEGLAPESRQAAEAQPIAPTEAGKVQIIDYSEKAIAVIGDTKSIKEKLKELGGRFNSHLTCGAGWIFPKTRFEVIKTALQVC